MIGRSISIAALLVTATGLVGCGVRYDPAVIDGERFTRNSPYLTFNTPVVTESPMAGRPGADEGAPAWWAMRNERGPSVAVGFESTEVREVRMRVRDRQRITNGRPRDSYQRNIRVDQVGRTVR